MKVLMHPHPQNLDGSNSGIAQVVINMHRHMQQLDVEFVAPNATSYDLTVGHAAAFPTAMVNISHGLLWTSEFDLGDYSWGVNEKLVQAARYAEEIITPSEWVAQVYRRDMKRQPTVIPWGVNFDDWQQHEKTKREGWVIWNKNRTTDGLDPTALEDIARAMPDVEFVSTFGRQDIDNLKVFAAKLPFDKMKALVQAAGCLIMTDRETFGIAALEAMAAGVPVITVNLGAVPSLVAHGVSGYIYEPGDLQGAIRGLRFCLENRVELGEAGREIAKTFTWELACTRIHGVFTRALKTEEPTVDVVIPCHNQAQYLERVIESVTGQSSRGLRNIIVTDDGSNGDAVRTITDAWTGRDSRVRRLRISDNSDVATARNAGAASSKSKYVCFVDADDTIEPRFISRLVSILETDRSLGLAYTGIKVIDLRGNEMKYKRNWPGAWDFDLQVIGDNQIPTCCVILREAFEQMGGYRSRYAPYGAGSEDSELFLRMGAYGWQQAYVRPQDHALFVHAHGTGDSMQVEFTGWHPWAKDKFHPFASWATPMDDKDGKPRLSHPVRSYEQPEISVIIPVGPGHEDRVFNALDSLEAQTFRNWEAIVVWDANPGEGQPVLAKTYPYVAWVKSHEDRFGIGAGASRNVGVRKAKAELLFFLDADDHLHPDCLANFLSVYNNSDQAVYSEYMSKMTKEQHADFGGQHFQDLPDGNMLILGRDKPFDCTEARKRPEGNRPYVWSGVTCLVPKAWHDEIGGFDESMASWEDLDYTLRLAWTGHCFTKIPEMLWQYDFTGGERRDRSSGDLMLHLQDTYDRLNEIGEIMPCNCGNSVAKKSGAAAAKEAIIMNGSGDSPKIAAIYVSRSRGQTVVRGKATKTHYGYISNGAMIDNVFKADIRVRPSMFICPNCRGAFSITADDVFCPRCITVQPAIDLGRPAEPEEVPVLDLLAGSAVNAQPKQNVFGEVPVQAKSEFKGLDIKGVNRRQLSTLIANGVHSFADVTAAGYDGLVSIKGIGPATARAMLQIALESGA